MKFQGSLVALVTPFTEDNQIDELALTQLIEWHIEEKSDGIILLGTTGEGWAVSEEERVSVIKKSVEVSKNQIPIIVGVGSPDTRTSVRYTEMAKMLKADGCLAITPYYNRPSQEGCIAHFKEIAKASLPMIVYHHPKRTGCFLELSTLEALSKIEEIVAIKDAYGDVDYMKQTPLPVLSGEDALSLKWYEQGACGTISVVGNIVPGVWARFSKCCLVKEFKKAEEFFTQGSPLIKLLALEPNPQCVKYAVAEMGKCRNKIRLPLLLPKMENQRKINAYVEAMFTNKTLSYQ